MPSSPFVVNVGALLRNPGMRCADRRSGSLGTLSVVGSEVTADSEATVEVSFESVPGAVVVTAVVSASWQGECRRCLAMAVGTVRSQVRELFERQPDPDETYPLSGDQLDLEPLARDAVLLELPLAPLCQEGCRGLCAICGADRNCDPCQCELEVPDPRWAALDALRDN